MGLELASELALFRALQQADPAYFVEVHPHRVVDEIRRLAPTATVDIGVSYTLVRGEGRDPGLEISLTAQNLFNEKPREIGQLGPYDTPYDSTNYSPIGRFIAFGIRRHW